MRHWDYLNHFQNYSWCVLKRVIYKSGKCEMQCDDENDQAKNNLSSKFNVWIKLVPTHFLEEFLVERQKGIFKRTHFIVWRNWDNMVAWRNWDNMEQTCKHSWRVLKRVIYKPGECEMQCDDENDQAKNNLSSKFRICKRTHFIVWRNWDNMEQNWDNMVVGGTGLIWKELFTNLVSARCSAMMRMTRPKTIWAASLGSLRGLIL